MPSTRLGVGIVGLQPGRSWAAQAHVPALRALPDRFEIVGVANSSRSSAEAAAVETGIPRAFEDVAALIAAPDVDLVTVAVRVPAHFSVVKAAIDAGKHVYCEWPLGTGLAEAERMTALAQARGIVGVVGMQAPFAPEIAHAKRLIADGFVGEVLSTTIVGWGGALQGAGTIPDAKTYAYLLDRANGATLLTIPVGHTLAALAHVLGAVAEVSAVSATRRPTALVRDTGERLPVSSPDQVLVSGVLASGVPIALHYRGGEPRDGDGLWWEINGTEGTLRLSGPSGHTQMVQLALAGLRGNKGAYRPLAVPPCDHACWPGDVVPGNVARVYAAMARDVRTGSHTAPRFDDAVALHRVLSAIELAAESGTRVTL